MDTCACALDEGQDSYLNADGYKSMYMKLEDRKYYILTYDAGETKVEINYCPFCGRCLNGMGDNISKFNQDQERLENEMNDFDNELRNDIANSRFLKRRLQP